MQTALAGDDCQVRGWFKQKRGNCMIQSYVHHYGGQRYGNKWSSRAFQLMILRILITDWSTQAPWAASHMPWKDL